jgi:hypothetical protein
MFHRPNFCCSCGEKIERIEWHIWTSRRHCELCETEHRFDEWLPRVTGIFLVFFGFFGVGAMIGGSRKVPDLVHSPVAMARERARAAPRTEVPIPQEVVRSGVPEGAKDPAVQAPASDGGRGSRTIETVPETQEHYYYCGAETRKGTACTRKVKGGGRCWQHKGREAILPESELEVQTGGS